MEPTVLVFVLPSIDSSTWRKARWRPDSYLQKFWRKVHPSLFVHVLGLGFVPGLVLVHVPLLVPAPAPALVPAVVTGTVFFPPLSRNEAMRSLLLTNFEPWKTDTTQSQVTSATTSLTLTGQGQCR